MSAFKTVRAVTMLVIGRALGGAREADGNT
jgi:hypothetical protein